MPYTLNGFGTRYYGRREGGEDGSYITTLWVTALYIPLLPLGSYRVMPVGKGTNWIVHASQSYMTRKVSLCWEQIWHVYMVGLPVLILFGGLIWASEKDDRKRKAFENRFDAVDSTLAAARGEADRLQSGCWNILKSSSQARSSTFKTDLQENCAPATEATETYVKRIEDMQELIEQGLLMSELKEEERATLRASRGIWKIRHHQGEEIKQILGCLTDMTKDCAGKIDPVFATLEKEDKDVCSILASISEKCE